MSKSVGQILSEFGKKTEWRERRMDAIIEAFARSTKDKPYSQMRDELLQQRGLGKIED